MWRDACLFFGITVSLTKFLRSFPFFAMVFLKVSLRESFLDTGAKERLEPLLMLSERELPAMRKLRFKKVKNAGQELKQWRRQFG